MKINLKKIKISELFDGYKDSGEHGIVGYGGRLNIRPPYQREFIYKANEMNAVIDVISKNFPLNVMHWAKIADQQWEVIDGQQRIISICKYCNGEFSTKVKDTFHFIHNLKSNLPDEYQDIMDYELLICECVGERYEILDWFRTIKAEGIKQTQQELRNISYTGPWLTNAKKYFSKTGCAAFELGRKYVTGRPIRHELLEKAILWKIQEEGIKKEVEDYMSEHMKDPDACPLWKHFQNVIIWIEKIFPKYRKEMKGVDWNSLYIQYKDWRFDSESLETEVKKLMMDDDIQNKSGIYPYLLTDEEKWLKLRTFTESMKRTVYEKQDKKCLICKKEFDIEEMEADHIIPWSKDGKIDVSNCQILCKSCYRTKSDK